MASPKSFTVVVKFRKLGNQSDSAPTISHGVANGLQGQPCTFKVDGQRFQTSSRTIKFHCDSKYHVHIQINPPARLEYLRIAGSECPLQVGIGGSSSPSTVKKPSEDSGKPPSAAAAGQYLADWDTAGLTPTHSGKREAINFALQGPDFMLSKAMQCKFYAASDSHAGWGNALDAIVYKCAIDSQGSAVVIDEEFK